MDRTGSHRTCRSWASSHRCMTNPPGAENRSGRSACHSRARNSLQIDVTIGGRLKLLRCSTILAAEFMYMYGRVCYDASDTYRNPGLAHQPSTNSTVCQLSQSPCVMLHSSQLEEIITRYIKSCATDCDLDRYRSVSVDNNKLLSIENRVFRQL